MLAKSGPLVTDRPLLPFWGMEVRRHAGLAPPTGAAVSGSRTEALLDAQSAALELMAAGAPADATLAAVAEVIEAGTGVGRCAFLALDERGAIQNLAAPSLDAALLADIEGLTTSDGEPGA